MGNKARVLVGMHVEACYASKGVGAELQQECEKIGVYILIPSAASACPFTRDRAGSGEQCPREQHRNGIDLK